jgi:type II secretion system protein N
VRLVGKILIGLAIAFVMFAVAVALTFPTDAVVRGVLARVTRPDGQTLVFEHAALRPWGLHLDKPAIRQPDGTILVTADWVTVRPSLWGFISDRTGRPWHLKVGGCGGALAVVLDRDGADTSVGLGWNEIDLGNCPALPQLGFTVTGVAEGTAKVRRATSGFIGEGRVLMRAAAFRVPGRGMPGLDTLHVDPGSANWSLDGNRVAVSGIEVRGPEVNATGKGTIRLAAVPAHSAIDFQLALTPGSKPNPFLLRLLDTLPPAEGGAHSLLVTGTFSAPQVVQ